MWTDADTIEGVACATLVGTPAAGDLSYWTSATAQALLTAASGSTGNYVRSQGTGAAPIWSTLVLPNTASAGTFLVAATANTVTASATPTLGASGTLGSITMGNATSGTVTLRPVTGALGTVTVSIPAATDTLVGKATTDTLTNKTFDTAGTGNVFQIAGTSAGATAQTFNKALASQWTVFSQGLPMIHAATGTMTGSPNGTGAFTLGTALASSVFPTRALVYFPINTVNASGLGSAAGWYFCTFSSTTAGVVVDTTPYTPSSTPPVWPASPVAPTTATNWTSGTGAITFITFDVPANAMGPNGILYAPSFYLHETSNANAKSWSVTFGAFTAISAQSVASQGFSNGAFKIQNRASQAVNGAYGYSGTGAVAQLTNGTVDTSSAVTVTISLNKSTATDNLGISEFFATVTY